MSPKQIRLLREQARKCRDLARSADELRRSLTDMAEEYENRASDIESSEETPRTIESVPLAPAAGQTAEPITLSIKDAARLLGLGRSTIYRLIGEGQLRTVKIGNRTLVKMASIRTLAEPQG